MQWINSFSESALQFHSGMVVDLCSGSPHGWMVVPLGTWHRICSSLLGEKETRWQKILSIKTGPGPSENVDNRGDGRVRFSCGGNHRKCSYLIIWIPSGGDGPRTGSIQQSRHIKHISMGPSAASTP
jgi:hypothetical protein